MSNLQVRLCRTALAEVDSAAGGCSHHVSFLLATRIPVLKRIPEPNRCILEPLKAETPKTTLSLVLAHGWFPQQVV